MKLSNHACNRSQQRGIAQKEMQILMRFGDELQGGSKATIFCVNSKQTRKEIESLWQNSRDFDLEGVVSSYLVVKEGDVVVTTGHRKIRFQKNRRAH
ncbi:hypothetical protein [Congregibacter litoralis]|uniref:DUF4258 domain-containing protein n=1 Tax=Congregibacter litoralis KT71 TaxID=314285 RepID=A4AD61_9GAMM|nr:hypothetical protein [Congregibacter litoralis]EAQ96114.2 hypothetical protein KT71_08660 [Congregibacter litoralis KT71]